MLGIIGQPLFEAAAQTFIGALAGYIQYDDAIVRKLVECIRVISAETIEINFKCGTNIRAILNYKE